MAVEARYVSTRDESKIWVTEAEADAYDKKLEFAENLQPLLGAALAKVGLKHSDVELEDLALALADDVENLRALLPAARKVRAPKTLTEKQEPNEKAEAGE